jgi:hypothetical protein
MSLEIEGPRGSYTIVESEILGGGEVNDRQLVMTHAGTKVYRVKGARTRYVLSGPTAFSQGKDHITLSVHGTAFRGRPLDREIYRRFEIRDPTGSGCRHGFVYGWNLDEP